MLGTLYLSQTGKTGPFTFLALTKLENQFDDGSPDEEEEEEEADRESNKRNGLAYKIVDESSKSESIPGGIDKADSTGMEAIGGEEDFTFPGILDTQEQRASNISDSPAKVS